MGRDAEAESLHRRALEVRTRLLGPSHFRTVESVGHLAAALSGLGRFEEAERLAAAAEGVKSLGEGNLVTLAVHDARARALLGLHRAAEAESVLRRQLAILAEKAQRGEDAGEGDTVGHPMRVRLGMALSEQGRRAEAEPLLLEAIPKLPPREADTARALRFLVRFYEEWNGSHPDPARRRPRRRVAAAPRGIPWACRAR